jgi:predicted RNA binding protein YcfA (HicA-like mRNA interferase family)
MRLPRDVNAQELIKHLKKLGYSVTRQSGSHIRLTTQSQGEHHITILNHSPIKIGTLSSILADVGEHFHKTKEDIIEEIF